MPGLRALAWFCADGMTCRARLLQNPAIYAAGKGLPALPSRKPGRAASPFAAVFGFLREPRGLTHFERREEDEKDWIHRSFSR